MPVPNLPTVQKGSMKCFYELSQYTQRHLNRRFMKLATQHGFGHCKRTDAKPEPPVKVIEIKTVGAYEIAVLSTKDSGALAKWLDTNQFYFPANKTDVLDAYVKQHRYFVAVKINLEKRLGTTFDISKARQRRIESAANQFCERPLRLSAENFLRQRPAVGGACLCPVAGAAAGKNDARKKVAADLQRRSGAGAKKRTEI